MIKDTFHMSVSQMGRRWCRTGGFLLRAGWKWALMECDTLLASTYAHPHIQSAASHALRAWWAALLCSFPFSQIKTFLLLQIYKWWKAKNQIKGRIFVQHFTHQTSSKINSLVSSRTSVFQLKVSTKKRAIKLVLTSKIKAMLFITNYISLKEFFQMHPFVWFQTPEEGRWGRSSLAALL